MRSRHLSRVITASPQVVYDYVANPANLPAWAAGLAEGDIELEGDAVIVDSPMGRVSVRFVARNDVGIVDHDVTLPSGATVTNPFRVLPHPQGAEVVFAVRQLDLTAEEFARDCASVERDLDRLVELLG